MVPVASRPLRPLAGIATAPGLTEGGPQQSCMSCSYYTQVSMDHDGGSCARHDFHTMGMWVCDDWEARAAEEPAGAEHDSGAAARAALAKLGAL